jgi:tRNA-specific 2-thiouridylase
MKKVIIGMSGGVDSSVAAAVLKENGFEVIGVTLSLYKEDPNTGTNDERDAAAVCEKLNIKHIIVDRREAFKNTVIKDFIDSYEAGMTPNPCVLCNKAVKFTEMLRLADELGADFVATGHYSAVKKDEATGRYLLYRPEDKTKDQTYMLYKLNQEQLSRILMPLANLNKEQVREKARALGLSVASRPDSQDICFVPDGDYAGFIERYTGKIYPEGDYVSLNGDMLGRHKGLIRYTVGQRKGLGIALGKPAFVVEKQADLNRVVISDNEELLFKTTVKLKDVNFIPFDKPSGEIKVNAKLRYRHKEAPATLKMTGEKEAELEFVTPQRAPAPGQAAVFYDKDMLVGGGTIYE